MNIQHNFQTVLGVTTLLLLGACANSMAPANPTGNALPQSSNAYTLYGVVQSIDLVQQQSVNAYKFTVRLSDGAYQSYTQTTNVDIRVGDRVQIDNSVLRRY